MKCAYCGEEAKGTREHIISSGILDLFPECDLTFDEYRKIKRYYDRLYQCHSTYVAGAEGLEPSARGFGVPTETFSVLLRI